MMRKKGNQGKFKKAGGVLLRVMQGVQYVPDNVLDKVRIREMAAIDNLASGEGTDYDLSMVIGLVAVCEYIAGNDKDQQAMDTARNAENELQRVVDTHKVGGGYVQMTETCLAAVKHVYTVHDEQRVMLTWKGYEEVLQAVNRKIVAAQAAERRAASAGNYESSPKFPKVPASPLVPSSSLQFPQSVQHGIVA